MKASRTLSGRGNEKTRGASGARGDLVHQLDLSVRGPWGMANVALGSVARQVGSLFEGGSAAGLSDRQLLERFTACGEPADEAAFAAMVARHGPMVLGVCRQLMGDHHHAEDAFQAVFLVLARQARSIRDPDRLGTWLYGVALRTARTARGRIARRRRTEEERAVRQSTAGSALVADRELVEQEQSEALHREIERLPGAFRVPVVLCYFEGLTLDEAAHRLRWPAGTLRSRLARAREKLRRGLARRGFALSTTALAAALVPRSALACVSSLLCDSTTRAAFQFVAKPAAAGTASAAAMALAKEVLRSMLAHKLKLTVLTLLFIGAIASGAASVGLAMVRQVGKPGLRQIAAKPDDVTPKPGPGRMFVVGRVVDPQGKPVPGAAVMVYAQSIPRVRTSAEQLSLQELGRASSDGSGRFRVDAPRTSSSRHDDFGAVALAPGYGAGWIDALDPDADQPTVDIALLPEQVIHGRLFDLQGQPARDVKLSVTAIRRVVPNASNVRRPKFEGPAFWWTHPDDLPGWPSPVITGADGRFILRGIGPGLRAFLSVLDARFNQLIEINTDAVSAAMPLSLALQPVRTIVGRVTYADTGKPVAHARVRVSGIYRSEIDAGAQTIITVADDEGRFHANTGPGTVDVSANAPDGQPYLMAFQEIDWPKGAVTHSADLALPRGAMVRGTVAEKGSGRPILGAIVTYNSHRKANDGIFVPRSRAVETVADGSYVLAVLPRPGYLFVLGPTDDYVLQELDSGLFDQGQPGRQRIYAHGFVACDPKPGSETKDVPDVKVALRQGVTVKGQVVGPNGEPVVDAWMLSRFHLRPRGPLLRIWSGEKHGTTSNGQFELHGLDPDVEVLVSFFEPKRKLGATVRFSGKPAGGEPIVVKLEPCATATARLVGPDGKPRGGFTPRGLISMVVTPGEFSNIKAQKDGTSLADEASLTVIDAINYQKDPASDDQGRIVFPALIPGASYRIVDRTTIRTPNGPQLRKEFIVKPGEALDLGDILIEKPQQ